MLKTLRWVIFALVMYFFVLPLIPAFRGAISDLGRIEPSLLVAAIALEFLALYCYTLLTHAALGPEAHRLTRFDLYRIQLSTRALGNILPGGSAASTALGFRLITSSGIPKPDAGFALATAGIGSAVVLNSLLWTALVVSLPFRGVNPLYGSAAVAGVILMSFAGAIVFGIVDDHGRLRRLIVRVWSRFGRDGDAAGNLIDHLDERIRGLVAERELVVRVVGWSVANWLLDATALWLFLRAFGATVAPDGLLIAFGLANIVASVPITPGGLGLVEGIYIPTLVGFGVTSAAATLGVLSYRVAQYWLPIVVGGIAYASLRIAAAPAPVTAQGSLGRLRLATRAAAGEKRSKAEWIERYAPLDRTGKYPQPVYDDTGEQGQVPPV